ncbi:hypothetical protein AB5I41_27420 [Sphingomonas sp. MMS24-JH45]
MKVPKDLRKAGEKLLDEAQKPEVAGEDRGRADDGGGRGRRGGGEEARGGRRGAAGGTATRSRGAATAQPPKPPKPGEAECVIRR